MNYKSIYNIIQDKDDAFFKEKASILVKDEKIERMRYKNLLDDFKKEFDVKDFEEVYIISSPGRTEICGNHTDHQNGVVVCAALNIDNVCAVRKENNNIVRFIDKKFNIKEVDLSNLNKIDEEENTTEGIIRGVASRLNELKYNIGGFSAYCDSEVLSGSGISSSACFENMIVEIFNALYNDDRINEVERAKISKYAENVYFGKPCGLMDQMSISVGGFTTIDFKNQNEPIIKKSEFNFNDFGFELMILNTNSSHADLSDEYAAMPNEMKSVAKFFNKEVLSEVEENNFYNNINKLREVLKNDRTILRAIHFFEENKRAKNFGKILENYVSNKIIDKDIIINDIINIMKESGNSSFEFLQNVYVSKNEKEQSLSIALAIASHYIGRDGGVCRVHGGGFSGTIQLLVKKEKLGILEEIEKVFGVGAVSIVKTRNIGTFRVF